MTRTLTNLKSRALWPLRLLVCCALLVPALSVAFPHEALAGSSSGSDDFSRADGPLGPDWTDISDGGLVIRSQAVAGTAGAGVSGDIRTAEAYTSDQYSQVTVTSTQLTGGQWIGPMVRAQNGGHDAYVGIYYWNNGSPDLMLFKRSGSNWAQLGSTYNSGPLAAGTQLEVTAVGSAISFLQNGVARITATDASLSGGAPGIMSYGTGQVGSWSGGTATATSGGGGTTYTVGGTVSGLSGTVVLKDNGGDNLSVSASGAFTFATALASGASYSVTVAASPSGESCSVASGSGAIASANVTNVAVSCTASSATSGSDDFSRADGPLGPDWTDISDGGLVIRSQAVAGTAGAGVSGDIRTAEAYTSDQYSQVTVTSTQLTGGQWIGPMVRAQNGGHDAYVGIYYWNNGSPDLMLFKRSGSNWAQLGSTYNSGPLAAGTQLEVTAVGSAISFLQNGVARITATDASLSGGAPGIMSYGTGQVGSWSGGTATATSGGGGTTYTVGGTVSGLSGTVVLKDNGGDNLSVSASGAFTFATALASGASYSVTVAASPSGESCSVASGSGAIASANVTNVAVSCTASSATSGSDDFSRADGPLGPDWTDISDGGLVIRSQAVAGTAGAGVSGDIRTAEAYTSDQYSQVTVTSTQLTGGQWIGPMVRAQNGGHDAYVGIYYWNNGSPDLMLFKRSGSNWAQLGSTYNSGPLAAGTQLEVTAVGSAISFLQNGVARITATDASLSGGAPGIMSYGTGQVGSWSGGTATATSGGGGTTYTVGGTVSGLSGTVVLKDNGGDNLSVSASGAFTFATALASGASYSVTVAASPSGESCSVASGSGAIASANVTNVAVSCTASSATSGSDDFSRADGPLGPDWTDISDGGLVIRSQAVAGTAGAGVSGDIRTAEAYTSDQYSQVTVTSTQLTGGQWIGPMVRAQNGGHDAYVGIYYWNNGSPDLMLFKRSGSNWAQLGSTYNSGPLAAGTQLEVTAVGSAISFLQNGVARITATDASLSGGAPGIMSYGTGQVGSWSGGTATATSGGGGTTYTVGGTVSGLSGTVVLKDNGGDNLSVSASGAFTFATALASGASYSVTVAASPSGESCSVASGSGAIASANVTNVAVSCTASSATSGSDDFSRADGPLGPDWTDISDGGLVIRSQAVAGTAGAGVSGDIRTAEAYTSDQYSQVTVTSTQLTGGQWIGPMVRAQNGGHDAYVGIYYWNNGSPDLMLFKRSGSNWAQLGSTYNSGPLAAGTQLEVTAVGSAISFLQNGVARITATDASLSGGAPGIMSYGTGQVGSWSGGTATATSGGGGTGFQVQYMSTDANGVASYQVISANNGPSPQTLRVLAPTNPAPGVPHNFLYVLPVEPGLSNNFGDGLETLRALDAQNKYNLTIIEPSFGIDPWYADNPINANVQYETFMTKELVPWVKQNLAITSREQNWLIGFSKSGIGGQDLILKYPGLFTLAASWDFPADMSAYDQFGSDSAAGYGTDANFQASYRLSQAFVDAHKGPFLSSNRIWIGGYGLYQTDDSDYNSLLTSEGIAHTTETPAGMAHRWDSGWVPLAMAALYQDSLALSGG